VPPGWQPGFIDYFFIGFTTTTAFAPTEAMPPTARAKALMIVQTAVSLVTIRRCRRARSASFNDQG
jgi:hypothetical protein